MSGTSAVLEIDDVGLRLATADGGRVTTPAVAVLAGRELLFGGPARARARLDPRRTFDRFWERLDRQPLTRAAGPAHSHADLAYFHLRDFWRAHGEGVDEVLLSAAVNFSRDQLALLLGVAAACELPVAGLVAEPVAAAAAAPGAGPRLVLEAHGHRVVATRVTHGDDGLRLGDSCAVLRRGLAEFADAWAGAVAERFVHEARFDPMHDAATEQVLYDRLPDWLALLAEQPTARAELAIGDRRHHVDLDRSMLMAVVEDAIVAMEGTVTGAGEASVVLGPRLGRLPGLAARLRAAAAVEVTVLDKDAAARAVLRHADAVRSDPSAPAHVTRLSAPEVPAGCDADTPPAPTHLLHGWRAHALGAQPLALPPDGRPLAHLALRDGTIQLVGGADAVRVNGVPARTRAPLAAGDRLEIDGQTLHLIAAVSDDGSA